MGLDEHLERVTSKPNHTIQKGEKTAPRRAGINVQELGVVQAELLQFKEDRVQTTETRTYRGQRSRTG